MNWRTANNRKRNKAIANRKPRTWAQQMRANKQALRKMAALGLPF
jgi:hypothetical protein